MRIAAGFQRRDILRNGFKSLNAGWIGLICRFDLAEGCFGAMNWNQLINNGINAEIESSIQT